VQVFLQFNRLVHGTVERVFEGHGGFDAVGQVVVVAIDSVLVGFDPVVKTGFGVVPLSEQLGGERALFQSQFIGMFGFRLRYLHFGVGVVFAGTDFYVVVFLEFPLHRVLVGNCAQT